MPLVLLKEKNPSDFDISEINVKVIFAINSGKFSWKLMFLLEGKNCIIMLRV